MGLAFRLLCWILYFPPKDISLASDLSRTFSASIRRSIACDIDEDDTSELHIFLKKVVQRSVEEYDRKSGGAVKKSLIGNWEEEKDLNAADLLELKCPNWFEFAQGKVENICGARLAIKGVLRGYCKIQTRRFSSLDRTTSLLHIASDKIARTILDNKKKNEARDWNGLDWYHWERSGMENCICTCADTCMDLPEVLLNRLKVTLEWIHWTAVTPGMRFNSFGSFGQPVLWSDLCWSDFEMD